ncbi:DUF4405 domain-containing protein [Mesorhizobium onobrychidis]|uniref:DUF4405 domain-containing protein n=1 Tax=Mesorhizobium onobrychidis TaxID=2775404 RepID=A0ABY5R422_9HYPH|nr:DUF4405 domain-containing protein [Mesorhizobium onobrychidis]UVC18233.1 DUF4405 domain-containing protein [Mesorhizobium onobrychidis]
MSHVFLLRLALDFTAAGLLLAGLAYYWLDNVAHELIGTGMFLLIFVHNVFNRRWYSTIPKARARGLINIAITLSLLTAMVLLLVTSLMISRTVFSFLPLNGGYTARQIHTLAAYWALIIVSIHLGLRWSVIMNAVRSKFGITTKSTARAVALRATAVAIAAYGVRSSFDMGIGSKLVAHVTMDFWDFENSTLGFFLRVLSIIGLYASLAHYTLKRIQNRKRRESSGVAASEPCG